MSDHSHYTRPLGLRPDRRGQNWLNPVIDQQRRDDWSAYVGRLHSAIVRTRLAEGVDGATLGNYLYRPLISRWRRPHDH